MLLSPGSADGCQLMMKELAHHYSHYFNRDLGRSGPLWGGRYYSCIAESSLYVLACYRYIELNPVRAGLVRQPAEYRWSSHGANAEGQASSLVAVSAHEELLALGTDDAARRGSYKNLFSDSLDETLLRRIRKATAGGLPLASETFKARIASAGSVSDTSV